MTKRPVPRVKTLSKRWIIFTLGMTILSCGPGGPKIREATQVDLNPSEIFTRKKTCADLGRIALSEEFKEDSDSDAFPRVSTDVEARWCYSEEKNTCFYSAKSTTVVAGTEKISVLGSSWEVKDLLTNERLLYLSGKELQDPEATNRFNRAVANDFCN